MSAPRPASRGVTPSETRRVMAVFNGLPQVLPPKDAMSVRRNVAARAATPGVVGSAPGDRSAAHDPRPASVPLPDSHGGEARAGTLRPLPTTPASAQRPETPGKAYGIASVILKKHQRPETPDAPPMDPQSLRQRVAEDKAQTAEAEATAKGTRPVSRASDRTAEHDGTFRGSGVSLQQRRKTDALRANTPSSIIADGQRPPTVDPVTADASMIATLDRSGTPSVGRRLRVMPHEREGAARELQPDLVRRLEQQVEHELRLLREPADAPTSAADLSSVKIAGGPAGGGTGSGLRDATADERLAVYQNAAAQILPSFRQFRPLLEKLFGEYDTYIATCRDARAALHTAETQLAEADRRHQAEAHDLRTRLTAMEESERRRLADLTERASTLTSPVALLERCDIFERQLAAERTKTRDLERAVEIARSKGSEFTDAMRAMEENYRTLLDKAELTTVCLSRELQQEARAHTDDRVAARRDVAAVQDLLEAAGIDKASLVQRDQLSQERVRHLETQVVLLSTKLGEAQRRVTSLEDRLENAGRTGGGNYSRFRDIAMTPRPDKQRVVNQVGALGSASNYSTTEALLTALLEHHEMLTARAKDADQYVAAVEQLVADRVAAARQEMRDQAEEEEAQRRAAVRTVVTGVQTDFDFSAISLHDGGSALFRFAAAAASTTANPGVDLAAAAIQKPPPAPSDDATEAPAADGRPRPSVAPVG